MNVNQTKKTVKRDTKNVILLYLQAIPKSGFINVIGTFENYEKLSEFYNHFPCTKTYFHKYHVEQKLVQLGRLNGSQTRGQVFWPHKNFYKRFFLFAKTMAELYQNVIYLYRAVSTKPLSQFILASNKSILLTSWDRCIWKIPSARNGVRKIAHVDSYLSKIFRHFIGRRNNKQIHDSRIDSSVIDTSDSSRLWRWISSLS